MFLELAYQNDPRIKKHREDEKRKKLEIKKAKEDAAAEEKKANLYKHNFCFKNVAIYSIVHGTFTKYWIRI